MSNNPVIIGKCKLYLEQGKVFDKNIPKITGSNNLKNGVFPINEFMVRSSK